MEQQSQPPTDRRDLDLELVEDLIEFLETYRDDGISRFLQRYPEESTLEVSWRDLYRYDQHVADDVLTQPRVMQEYLDEALRNYDFPVDFGPVQGEGDPRPEHATVAVHDLPPENTYYPGGFSPTDEAGGYRAIQGEIAKATDVYSKLVEAAFECQRCGTLSRIKQSGEEFQEPHECQGCERQGPFNINREQSEYIDAQALRIQTPPEVAQGAGQHIDAYVEDDLADQAEVGDRVTISGTVKLEQITSGNQKTAKFEPYLMGRHIHLDESDHQELDVTSEERERIRELANGAEGDPLDAAGGSLTKLYTDEKLFQVQRMAILSMVGGSRVEYPDGDADRGTFNMLLLGDPGTGKSKVIERVENIAWRSVGVSGKGASEAGVTAAAERDDFGDASEWTLSAGAFVKANGGVVCIDELDDMPPDVRAAMLEPMSKQTIHISKAGINTKLQAQTAVVAAGNPKYGRFDQYEPLAEQFDLESSLLSRFDLIYTLTDKPDREHDGKVVGQIAGARDAAKRESRDLDVREEDAERIDTPVDADLLQKWVALASRQPAPVFESPEVREQLETAFSDIRGANGYDNEDAAVPVTFRKFEGIIRVAEAAAKFEFSDVITERHARIATEAVGLSMQDFGKDQDGNLDADVVETGESKKSKDLRKVVGGIISELQKEYEDDPGAPVDVVIERCVEAGMAESKAEHIIYKKGKPAGAIYEPQDDYLRFVGWKQ